VYITNIVKYRPPENRDPTPEEKKEFLPYLLRQIDVIKPKLVVTLGRHSGMIFFPELQISRDHGQAKKISLKLENKETKLVVLPLYHPAAALYNGSQRQILMNDFLQIPQLLLKITNNK
jgi:uracil-DNA glycosylase